MAKSKTANHLTPKESLSAFRSAFDKLSQTQSYATVFGDFVDFTLLMLNINKKPADFAELEKRWTKPEEHQLFAEMLFQWNNASEPFRDNLGDLFMECVSHGRNGQFFTPDEVCEMMAQITLSNRIKLEAGQTICDCACGSGRTLLAGAKIYRATEGFNPSLDLKYYAADNDLLCVKMATINFLVNSMSGEVAHMDSLTLDHYQSYHIRTVFDGRGYIPYYYITGPTKTGFIERLNNTRQSDRPQEQRPSAVETPPDTDLKIGKRGQLILF